MLYVRRCDTPTKSASYNATDAGHNSHQATSGGGGYTVLQTDDLACPLRGSTHAIITSFDHIQNTLPGEARKSRLIGIKTHT